MTATLSSAWLDMLGGSVRYYAAGAVRTRALECGDTHAEPVVLLHGVSGHAETWLKNVVPLGQRWHVYAIDLVGHGFTDKPPDLPYTIDTFVEHILAFLDVVGAESAHFVGQSLGGWVASWLAYRHPQRARSITLVTSAGLQVTSAQTEVEQQHAQVRRVTQAALEAPTRETVRKRLEWLMYDPSVITDELVEVRYRVYTRPDTQAVMPRVLESVTGEARWPYMLTPDRLRELALPTLVLWSRHNPTTQWAEGQAAAELLPNAEFRLFENCAHWPQFEQAEQFNTILTEFLTPARPSPPSTVRRTVSHG